MAGGVFAQWNRWPPLCVSRAFSAPTRAERRDRRPRSVCAIGDVQEPVRRAAVRAFRRLESSRRHKRSFAFYRAVARGCHA